VGEVVIYKNLDATAQTENRAAVAGGVRGELLIWGSEDGDGLCPGVITYEDQLGGGTLRIMIGEGGQLGHGTGRATHVGLAHGLPRVRVRVGDFVPHENPYPSYGSMGSSGV